MCNFLVQLGEYTGWRVVDAAHSAPFLSRSTPFPPDSASYFWSLAFDPARALEELRGFWHNRLVTLVTGSPRTIPHLPKYAAYCIWMGLRGDARWHPHMRAAIPRELHVCLMRFRLGCWHRLEVNRARRRSGPRTPRAQRCCPHCLSLLPPLRRRCVEDELHVLFECPRYASARAEFPTLDLTQSPPDVFAHADPLALAQLLHRIAGMLR